MKLTLKGESMKKKDIILIGSILLAASVGWLALQLLGRQEGRTLRITVDGEEYGTWSLAEDDVIDVDTEYGHNRVRIESGKAYMEEADCPDGYCRKQGSVHTRAESIICLPHKLVAEVLDESGREAQDNELDVVAK